MSFTFRMVFEGVCAFVPEGEGFFKLKAGGNRAKPGDWSPGKVKGVTVLLPDLRSADLATWKFCGRRYFRAPHYPLLGFRADQVQASSTRRIDLVVREPGDGFERGIMLLRKEQVQLELPPATQQKFSFDATQPSSAPYLPDAATKNSVWWLPRLSHISSAQSTPAPGLDPKIEAAFPDELAARVEIGQGHFYTFDFNRGKVQEPIPWRFAPPEDAEGDGEWNQALASRLAVEIHDIGERVTLRLRRIANEVYDETLVLAPNPLSPSPVVEVHVKNIELEDLLDTDERDEGTFLDPDFQAFYQVVSKDKGALDKLPVPNPGGKIPAQGVTERPCAPAAFEPFVR